MDFKIVLYGDYGIGKTSLTTRLTKDSFDHNSQTTLGASLVPWHSRETTKNVAFRIWDTAGQERFLSILPLYLRGASAIFYCWDSTVEFNAGIADESYAKAIQHSPDCHFYLVITKTDLYDSNKINSELVEKWASEKGIKGCHFTSSLTGRGVRELFRITAENLLSEKELDQEANTISLENSYQYPNWRSACCW